MRRRVDIRRTLIVAGDVLPKIVAGLAGDLRDQVLRAALGRRPHRPPDPDLERLRRQLRLPWPQPNPHAPARLAPSVLNLPGEELQTFRRVTLHRLRRTLRTKWPAALRFAAEFVEAPPITDEEFSEFMTETLFSKAMNRVLDEADLSHLAECGEFHGVVYKMDNSPASLLRTVDGTYSTGTISYFVRPDEGSACVPLAILVLDPGDGDAPVLIRSVDGDAWELAKHFALQSAENVGLVGTHPLVHFPMDAVNALSKAILPPKHLVAKLLAPHLYLQLCLNYSVMFIRQSPLHNREDEFFTGFTWKLKPALDVAQSVYSGVPDSSTYPAYRFTMEPRRTESEYGAFLRGYYVIIKELVAAVLQDQGIDESLLRWADECARHVPGFPGAEAIQQRDNLMSTVAMIICNCSVEHSADHYTFGQIPLAKKSLRIRVPPPSSRSVPPLDRRAFTTADDRFRMYLTHEMHITPSTETRLADVDYGFEDPAHVAANLRFRGALRAFDANPGVRRYAPLDELACSIQY